MQYRNKLVIYLALLLLAIPYTIVAQDGNRKPDSQSKSEGKPEPKGEDKDTYTPAKFNGVTIGVDISSPILSLFSQQYCNYEFSIDAGFYNRFYPVYEVGIGVANEVAEESNYTYKVKPSFYNRIGLNYNIIHKKDSPGLFYVGLRYGFSVASYDLEDITISSSYWETTASNLSIPNGTSISHWGEGVAGIQLKLYKGLMMGWSVRYKILFNSSSNNNANTWIIPGYGKTDNPIGFTYTINYRFSPKER